MTNSSGFGVTTIILHSYIELENLKALYFCIFLLLYIVIVVENMALIGLIFLQKCLHEPMYFLVCNLALNGLYGSTALLPALLKNILSRSHEVPLSSCLMQVFTIHTYAIVEFTILAVMSYDRYVAICSPLHYHTIMSICKVYKMITFTWLYPLIAFLLVFILTLQLRFCDRIIERLYCVNHALVKLSCTNTAVINIVGLLSVVLYSGPQICMIAYTYVQIMKICASSRESRFKALRTCTPHLLALINYTIGCFFEIAQSRLSHLQFESGNFMSLYFLIFPPILNPAIYGMSIQRIRTPLLRMLHLKGWA